MLVADGFGAHVFADLGIEPASGVQAARLSSKGQPPFPEALFEEGIVQAREVADFSDAESVQVLLGDLGHFAAWEQPQLLSEEVRAGFRSLRSGVAKSDVHFAKAG